MATEKPEKEPIKDEQVILETPVAQVKPEPKKTEKTEKKTEAIKPVYPRYSGYSCPVCGSKRVTSNEGQYICPVMPKPPDCPVK